MASEQTSLAQKLVVATMKNQSPSEIYCERYFNWANKPGPFPPNVPADGTLDFEFGSKGAVIYNGPPNAIHQQSGWLLAWDACAISTNPTLRKVYVTCGTKSDMDKLTEAEILEKLMESSDESKATDYPSRTTIEATLKRLPAIIPVIGNINVTFGTVYV